MPSHLAETFLGRGAAGERQARERRAHPVAEEMTREGTRVDFAVTNPSRQAASRLAVCKCGVPTSASPTRRHAMGVMLGLPVSLPERDNYDVELGPLFTSGVLLIAYGFFTRRPLAVAAGLGAVWLDQRSEFGRSLKRRVRSATEKQIKARARSASAVDERR